MAEIFNIAFIQIISTDKAKKGFQISVNVPHNLNNSSGEDFLPGSLSFVEESVLLSISKTFQQTQKMNVYEMKSI